MIKLKDCYSVGCRHRSIRLCSPTSLKKCIGGSRTVEISQILDYRERGREKSHGAGFGLGGVILHKIYVFTDNGRRGGVSG